jgi:hypothetical protein
LVSVIVAYAGGKGGKKKKCIEQKGPRYTVIETRKKKQLTLTTLLIFTGGKMRKHLFLTLIIVVLVLGTSINWEAAADPPGGTGSRGIAGPDFNTHVDYRAFLDFTVDHRVALDSIDIPDNKRFIIQAISGWGFSSNTNIIRALRIDRRIAEGETDIYDTVAYIPIGPPAIMYVDQNGFAHYNFYQSIGVAIDPYKSFTDDLQIAGYLVSDCVSHCGDISIIVTGYLVDRMSP